MAGKGGARIMGVQHDITKPKLNISIGINHTKMKTEDPME